MTTVRYRHITGREQEFTVDDTHGGLNALDHARNALATFCHAEGFPLTGWTIVPTVKQERAVKVEAATGKETR